MIGWLSLMLVDLGAALLIFGLFPLALIAPRHEIMPWLMIVTAALILFGLGLSTLPDGGSPWPQ